MTASEKSLQKQMKTLRSDNMVKIHPVRVVKRPGKRRQSNPRTISIATAKKTAMALKANKALQLKRAGFTFQKIADELGYTSQQMAWYAVHSLLKKAARLEYEDMIQLHVERTEEMLMRMQPAIMKGNPRAIEVAVKVLDRQAELLGLDYEDRKDAGQILAPIQINILADPRDADAQRFLAEIAARTGPVIEQDVQRPLLPSTEGDPQQ